MTVAMTIQSKYTLAFCALLITSSSRIGSLSSFSVDAWSNVRVSVSVSHFPQGITRAARLPTVLPYSHSTTNFGNGAWDKIQSKQGREENDGPKHLRINRHTRYSAEATDGKLVAMETPTYQLQTRVTRFKLAREGVNDVTVDLHAQVHFGDPSYFLDFNFDSNKTTDRAYDRVYYELICPESLFDINDEIGIDKIQPFRNKVARRPYRLKESSAKILAPNSMDETTAIEYGLTCQINGMSSFYVRANWYCCDFTSEEWRAAKNKIPQNGFQLFSTGSAAAEVVQALIRPITPAHPNLEDVETKLFTSMFLPSSEITSFLRALLWLTVPVPELAVLILDWSSLTPRSGKVSPIASAVVEAIFRWDLKAAKKLVFAQTLVSGQANIGRDSLIIGKRNDMAIGSILHSIDEEDCSKIALLYGALHCRDLQKKLENLGFVQTDEQWKTAWSAEVPPLSTSSKKSTKKPSLFTLSISSLTFFIYLAISGADWISTVENVLSDSINNDGASSVASLCLYLFRHVIFYFGLSKFIVQWDAFPFDFDDE